MCHGQPAPFAWPAQIVTDAAAVGVTLTTDCGINHTATGNEIMAFYLSTDAKCTGVKSLDANIAGCLTGDNDPTTNGSYAPTAADDTAHGFHLDVPEPGGTVYRMWMDVGYGLGATGLANPTCSQVGPFQYGFKKIQ
jgi:hypothetical protein